MLLYVRILGGVWRAVRFDVVIDTIAIFDKLSYKRLERADSFFVFDFAAVLKINVRNVNIENYGAGLYLLISTGEKLHN